MPRRQLGSTAVWPVVARAQQRGGVRRIGVLFASSPEQTLARMAAFHGGLS
jgi:hypothetical protein